jgi:glycosyltransferase involved in cell wall biosynthesis
MKVLIALTSSSGQLAGVPRHAINLARCLLTRSEIAEVHLAIAPWQMGFIRDAVPRGDERLRLHIAPIGKSVLSRNLWFYARLPRLARNLNVDIVHLAYPVPVRRSAFHCPTVVSLHDLYPYDIPENFGYPKVLAIRYILRRCLRKADAIACVSRSTFSRLQSICPKIAQKATVVRNSLEQQTPSSVTIVPPEWRRRPFLLCVAQHKRNKNVLLALRIFDRLLRTRQLSPGTRLLVVGIPGPETAAIKQFVVSSGLSNSVLLLSGISDAQLQWCYRNCRLALAPSVVEGFGLPVAEALLAGCSVVCSDIPAFRELGGRHCHYARLGPDEIKAFADATRAALSHSSPKAVDLPQLSTRAIARQYLALYQSLMPVPATDTDSQSALFPLTREMQGSI